MHQLNTFEEMVHVNGYPHTDQPMSRLKRCPKCGRMTFLNMPCGWCGGTPKPFTISQPGDVSRKYDACLYAAIGAVAITSVVLSLFFVHWLAAVVFALLGSAVTMLITLETYGIVRTGFKNDGSWLESWYIFCRLHKWSDVRLGGAYHHERLSAADPVMLEPLLDAWYTDMDRLERSAVLGDWTTVLNGTRVLADIYRNARLSRLQYRAMLEAPDYSAGACELDDVCAHLETADLNEGDLIRFMRLIEDAVSRGACTEQNHIKRLYTDLLKEYVRRLNTDVFGEYGNAVLSIDSDGLQKMIDAVGKETFLACGGVLEESSRKQTRKFFDAYYYEIQKRRLSVILSGKWYALLTAVCQEAKRSLDGDAKIVINRFWKLFFGEQEFPEAIRDPGSFYGSIERYDQLEKHAYDMILPETRHYFGRPLREWEIDENGTPYTQSEDELLRCFAEG